MQDLAYSLPLIYLNNFCMLETTKKAPPPCTKDDDAESALSWYHLDFLRNSASETRSCPLTEATVDAHRVNSQVDFTPVSRCVAPSRSSLQTPYIKRLVPTKDTCPVHCS